MKETPTTIRIESQSFQMGDRYSVSVDMFDCGIHTTYQYQTGPMRKDINPSITLFTYIVKHESAYVEFFGKDGKCHDAYSMDLVKTQVHGTVSCVVRPMPAQKSSSTVST